MKQTILSAIAASILVAVSTQAVAQAATKENVDKLRDREVVNQMREECRAENERACQVMFLLRYISQVETNGMGIRRELQSREDELHRLECRLSELEIEVARGYFKSAIEEGNATEAEKAIRAIFLNENALIENCPG